MWLSNVPMEHPVFSKNPRWANNYWVHTRIMNLFGDMAPIVEARRTANILYRVEPGISRGRVLVQSAVRPIVQDVKVIDLTQVIQHLNDGSTVRFQIKINTVKTVNHNRNGQEHIGRKPIPDNEIPEWFYNKISPALSNIEIDSCVSGSERQNKGSLAVASISGTAIVNDMSALSEKILHGVGKAKSFGCGLLSVIPAG